MQDPHRDLASRLFQTPISQVTPDQRRRAKSIRFAAIYGNNQAENLIQSLASMGAEAQSVIERRRRARRQRRIAIALIVMVAVIILVMETYSGN